METVLFTLPSGLRVIHRQNHSNVAYCGLTINAGTRDEVSGEHGIAHLTEHMLFKGTKKHSSHFINNRLENVGGELNAFTTKEETGIHATILKNDLGKALELIAEMSFNATFPEKEAEKEKLVIIDEINSYKDNPSEQIFDDFEERLFAGAPIGRNILGTESSLLAIAPLQLHAFKNKYYHPQNSVLSIVGKYTAKRIEQLAAKYFGDLNRTANLYTRTAPPIQPLFTIKEERNTFQAHCVMGSPAYSLHDPKRIGLALFSNYLGGPASNSLFNTLLREKYGLVYTVESNYSPYSDCGALTIYFGTDRGKVQKCQELIIKELEKLKKNPLSGMQLHRIKKQMLGQLAIATDNAEAQMLSQAKSILAFNKVETTAQTEERINAVTSRELQEISEEVLSPDKLSCLIYN
jgi:predicted Zn-dependent peptidase